jgi:nicotinamide phosphoribosyltransferase
MFKPISLFYSDGYKVGHKKMLAKGTTRLYGTWIPRSTKYAPGGITKIVSFGQQLVVRWLHDEFTEHFFSQPRFAATQFGKDMSMYLGMDYDASHFEALHDLGYLPIRIKSLPEGIETNPNVPHMTFINTVDGFAWLTLYLETIISSLAWKPATSATIALQYRRNLAKWVMKTDPANAWLIPYLAHDFSARGLSPWDMLSSGLGHATSFRGSDSIICIPGARYFYNEPEDQVAINSVNASEHSVSTTKIFTVGEQQMIADWLKDFPIGILSIVSDTFDLWKLITEYLPANKEAIMTRDGKLVIRPDSGDPVDIICGSVFTSIDADSYEEFIKIAQDALHEDLVDETPHGEYGGSITQRFKWNGNVYDVTYDPDWNRYDKQYYFIENFGGNKTTAVKVDLKPSDKGVIELLWDIFGGTINEQGYKVLDPHIGAIYGDSITLDRQIQIYERLAAKGFSSTNIVLGVGSYTYQMNTRDTLGFAAKGAWFEVAENGIKTGYDIYKDPVTDNGTKKSLKGRCAVHLVDGEYVVKTQCTEQEETGGILHIIYEDGKFYNQTTLSEIRDNLIDL